MIVYGYVWMGVTFVLFLFLMYAAYVRALLETKPLTALVLALAGGYTLRVMSYLQVLKLFSFQDLVSGPVLLAASLLGLLLLIAYTFLILAVINLVFPRTLRGRDISVLASLGGTGVSLISSLYGIFLVTIRQMFE